MSDMPVEVPKGWRINEIQMSQADCHRQSRQTFDSRRWWFRSTRLSPKFSRGNGTWRLKLSVGGINANGCGEASWTENFKNDFGN